MISEQLSENLLAMYYTVRTQLPGVPKLRAEENEDPVKLSRKILATMATYLSRIESQPVDVGDNIECIKDDSGLFGSVKKGESYAVAAVTPGKDAGTWVVRLAGSDGLGCMWYPMQLFKKIK